LDRAGGLDEQHGFLRRTPAAFLSVLPVVEADGEQVGGNERREQFSGCDEPVGDAEVAEDIPGDFAGRAVGLQGRVGGAGGSKVADDAHGGISDRRSRGWHGFFGRLNSSGVKQRGKTVQS